MGRRWATRRLRRRSPPRIRRSRRPVARQRMPRSPLARIRARRTQRSGAPATSMARSPSTGVGAAGTEPLRRGPIAPDAAVERLPALPALPAFSAFAGLRRLLRLRSLRASRPSVGSGAPAASIAPAAAAGILVEVGLVVAESGEERIEAGRLASGGPTLGNGRGRAATVGTVGLLGLEGWGRLGDSAPGRLRFEGLLGRSIRDAEDGVEARPRCGGMRGGGRLRRRGRGSGSGSRERSDRDGRAAADRHGRGATGAAAAARHGGGAETAPDAARAGRDGSSGTARATGCAPAGCTGYPAAGCAGYPAAGCAGYLRAAAPGPARPGAPELAGGSERVHLEESGLGRLSLPDLPSRQGSLRPHGDLGAWRRTVGHEGGLEHVGGPSAYRGGKGTGR